ncbi:amino acid permease-domain-containing protein [Amylocystis lapponica]|nr:amino acid permease-domain-containing protein [Amylocystis lapponica]
MNSASPDPEAPAPPDYGTAKTTLPTNSQDPPDTETPLGAFSAPPVDKRHDGLHRGLSARQVSMIAVAGTIGTGLFLGTGRSLAQGGPASMLICYAIVGAIVYVTLLLLGEMATQYPVAGSFNAYATRFFSPAYGFALSWNYWFNDAVSVASDLTAAQLVLQFWTPWNSWVVSLVFWVFLVAVNAAHVRAYGELEYWLSSLKVVTVILFIVVGVFVNLGANREHEFIGAKNWRIQGAPFVGGFGGFARVFVTASFAYGGTESLGITAGETKNPSRNMPRVVKLVFWRILLFYILSIALIGLNVPWDYPGLSNRTTTTSPFTIVFREAGSSTRVLYGLATARPAQAPALFARTTRAGVPLPALLATSSVSVLCFGSSFLGSGVLWGWLQNIVGVSNQIAWLSIGLASWRFRRAWLAQGRPLHELKFRAAWTWPWGPPFVIGAVSVLILVQGWSAVLPRFRAVEFVSFYVELPVMLAMCVGWLVVRRPREGEGERRALLAEGEEGVRRARFHDLVDPRAVDLRRDEHAEEEDGAEDAARERRVGGRWGVLWRLYYVVA